MQETRYIIRYSPMAEKELKKNISKDISKIILRSIDSKLSEDPYGYGKELVGRWKDHRSMRVGDYRVIFKIMEKEILVLIIKIGHRKDVYE